MIRLYYFRDKRGKYRLRIRCGDTCKQIGRDWDTHSSLRSLRAWVEGLLFAMSLTELAYVGWRIFCGVDAQYYWRAEMGVKGRWLGEFLLGGGVGYHNRKNCVNARDTVRNELAASYEKWGITKDK